MKKSPAKQAKPRTEALDQAAAHLRAGKLADALTLYQELYDQSPDDWTVANALGDLHVRMKNDEAASEVFMSLAEHMAEQGHSVKARALYRKVLRMRPGDQAATQRVAELENVHLDASPFMRRVRGALLDAQAAAPAAFAAAEPQPETEPEHEPAALPVSSEPIPVAPIPLAPIPLMAEPAAPEASFVLPQPEPPLALAPESPLPFSPDPNFTFSLDLDPAPPVPAPVALAPPAPPAPLAPLTVVRFEPEIPAPQEAADEPFQPRSGDWIPTGLSLAAAPLSDRVRSSVPPTRAAAFQKTAVVAQRAAGQGDFRTAMQAIEAFLLAHPQDIEALEFLVGLGVDERLDTTDAQLRLADACISAGRMSSARHIALDLLNRNPTDPGIVELVDRIFAAGEIPRPARQGSAPVDADAGPGELFDDDGLVTDAERPRAAARPAAGITSLDDWLDAADESDAHEAVATATSLAAEGNAAGAKATLEPLMQTPALRPIVGVHLAQLYRREGDLARALLCLEQAAEQPPVHEDNAHALAYELALTLEAMGQRHEALALYRELLSEVGPAFRDVAARAEQLSAA